MKAKMYNTEELSQEELFEIKAGSLSEVAYAIWDFIGFSGTLNSRLMDKNDRVHENFYNH
ncbi:hypothetical protein [Bacteroides intestinalis]|jgi:hypothetical protein|uniref:hypothetical protein n=1 Tax=Bacteroides intestinalis TaxID=329854 RepID=UPI00189F048F|nr:hypothetical protein [Bacteroides intestinalis]